MIFISPLGAGFFLFFQRFVTESVNNEVAEFDLTITREKNNNLSISREKLHILAIKRINES